MLGSKLDPATALHTCNMSTISYPCGSNIFQVLSTAGLQHAVHLRDGRVRDADGDEGAGGGNDAAAGRRQVPRHPRRGLRVVRNLLRPLWTHNHRAANQVSRNYVISTRSKGESCISVHSFTLWNGHISASTTFGWKASGWMESSIFRIPR